MPVFLDVNGCDAPLNLMLPARFAALGTTPAKEAPVCFGREKELARLSALLLPEFSEMGSVTYSTSSHVAMAVLTGQNGIGKSTLISAFNNIISSRKFVGFGRSNVSVFHDTTSSFTTDLPLSAWRPVLRQMVQLLEDAHPATGSMSSEASKGDFADGSYLQNLEALMARLTAELGISKETPPDLELSMPQKLAALGEQIVDLVLAFADKTGNRVVIVM